MKRGLKGFAFLVSGLVLGIIGATFWGRSEDTACLFIFQSMECAGLTRRPFCFLFCFTFMYMTCLSQF